MEEVRYFINQLTDPEMLIHTGGLLLVLLVVFAENGIFFAFFLPGDTLLFTAGLLNATGKFQIPTFFLILTLCIAAILGSLLGYLIGLKTGKGFNSRTESIFFKKSYITTAEAFFLKYGGRALILGRFLPIIRTFAPIFAGIVKVKFGEYLLYNIIGGVLWVVIMTLLGFYIGRWVPNAKDYLEHIIIGIIIITWIPVVSTYLKEQRAKRNVL
jgi:membrane-associated protein